MGMGILLNRLGIFGPDPAAFGHPGRGGSFGCADPKAGLAMGYTVNQLGGSGRADPRSQALVAAVHAANADAR